MTLINAPGPEKKGGPWPNQLRQPFYNDILSKLEDNLIRYKAYLLIPHEEEHFRKIWSKKRHLLWKEANYVSSNANDR